MRYRIIPRMKICRLVSVLLAGVTIISFISFAGTAVAEQLLTLDQAIKVALEDGYQMKSIRLSLLSAEQNSLAARYRFRTNANLSFNTPNWSETMTQIPVANALPVYNRLGAMKVQGQFNINQPLPTDGTLTLRSQVYQSRETNYFAENDTELKRKDFLTSLSLVLIQPLFTYNRLQTGLKQAELNYENSRLSFNRTQLDVVYQVSQSFYSLYRQTRTYEINKETLDQTQKAYDLARLKFEAGLIPEVEALQVEVDLADAQATLFSAEADLNRQKDVFKQTLGLSLAEDVGVVTDITYAHFDVDLNKAIEYGLANRFEIREGEIAVALREINVMTTDANTEVKANLVASYDFTGRSDTSLPFNTATSELFDSSWDDLNRRPGNRSIALTVTVPVWDWGVNKAEVASATANLRRAQIDLEEERKTIETGIREVVNSVKAAESRMEVLLKSQEVAQRTYDISLERFDTGEITSQDLALDSNRLSSAKLAYLNAYITYKLAVANLKRFTLWDFERNQSLVE